MDQIKKQPMEVVMNSIKPTRCVLAELFSRNKHLTLEMLLGFLASLDNESFGCKMMK